MQSLPSIRGVIVVSVPKCGTNFLSRYLSSLTGWPHRWGRLSRDELQLQKDLPEAPDEEIARRSVHLIQTDKDIVNIPEEQRPTVFGNRKIKLVPRPEGPAAVRPDPSLAANSPWIIAEHPLHSLAYFLRNPDQAPIVYPQEVVEEATHRNYHVVFLSRNLRDIVNSLAHFLHAGTRYVQFPTLEDSLEICVYRYAPVLARAIRTWRQDFEGLQIAYEQLATHTRTELQRICQHLGIAVDASRLIDSTSEFRTFTFRKGGTDDWRNHLTPVQSAWLEQEFPDLV